MQSSEFRIKSFDTNLHELLELEKRIASDLEKEFFWGKNFFPLNT